MGTSAKTKKVKAKKKCCVTKPRCKRCPVRLHAEAKQREDKRKKKREKKKNR